MFPHPSSATPPVAAIASKPQENDSVERGMPPGKPPSGSGTDGTSIESPEPHWDSVIGAATD